MEKAKETVETGISQRLQPWQSLFALLTYAFGVYGIEDEKAIMLYAIILAALVSVQLSTYKHQQEIKKVIAPWLVEQVLNTLKTWLKDATNVEEVSVESSSQDVKARLRTQIDLLEKELEAKTAKNGKTTVEV